MSANISFEDTSVAFSYRSDRDLNKSFLLFSSINNRLLVKLGTNIVKIGFKIKLPVKGIIRNTIFSQFCGGESIIDCESTIQKLADYNVGTILDFAVEGEDSEEDYDNTVLEILKTIDKAKANRAIPFSVFKPTGVADIFLLEKLQLNKPLTKEESKKAESVKQRFFTIAKHAYESEVRLFIDSEDSWIQDPIDALVYDLMREFNKERAIVFNTYQMYRKKMLENLQQAVALANGKYIIGAKLVRGAYMEKERERAEEQGYEDPIMPDKIATDNQYNDALKFCVKNVDDIHFCSGSHNESSNRMLADLIHDNKLDHNDDRIFFAQLYGMSDNITFNLAKAGYNVAKYVPYGPIESVMPYLFRRAEENTAIAGQSSRELQLIKKELKRRKNST